MSKFYLLIFILYILNPLVTYNKSICEPTQFLRIKNQLNFPAEQIENIDITVTVEKEIFPVIAKFLFDKNNDNSSYGLVKWNIKNKNNSPIDLTLSCTIQDWTSSIINNIKLNPNENKEFRQSPFSIQFLKNQTILPATILLEVKKDNKIIFEETRNSQIRANDDMVWSLYNPFDTENLIAAWVTPNNEMVEKIISLAKERRFFNRTLSGYQSNDIIGQVKAIFNAVREYGISYVSSTVCFGKVGYAQRVRLPKESISQKSANCIDGAVLFASLFENIGFEPLIVLLQDHAFVGIRTKPNSKESLFIETTIVGRSKLESILNLERTFDAAVREGNAEFNKAIQSNPNSVHIIDIKQARSMGIYPLE